MSETRDDDKPTRLRLAPSQILQHPIACRTRELARCRGARLPTCAWKRDREGYTCQVCASWIGPGMNRHPSLAHAFGDGDEPVSETIEILDVKDEILTGAQALAHEPREDALLSSAAALIIDARRRE